MKILKNLECPDWISVNAGSDYTKSWRVVNNGITQWPENSILVMIKGSI